ncbi:MAG: hypothetical protein KDA99_18065, partial [Planctomycetales bacterium]|nr:hypothetical protein [Planctomycetales bacterium]
MITVPVNEQRPITLIGGAAWWMFGLALVVIATTYFWADHRWETSTMPEFAAEVEEMSASTGGGHIWRRFGFIMLAGMGGVLVAWPNGNRVRIHGLLPWFVLALFAYSIASVTWSLEPAITLRRVLVLVFCFIGAIGVARTLGPRQVCLLCLLLPSWFLMLGVVAELAHGTFRPWVGEYRFAGTMHPNAQGYHLAIAFLAANSLRKQAGGYTGILLVWMVVMFSFLVMTKSRTAVGAAVLGAFTLWWLQTPIRFRVLTGLLGAT